MNIKLFYEWIDPLNNSTSSVVDSTTIEYPTRPIGWLKIYMINPCWLINVEFQEGLPEIFYTEEFQARFLTRLYKKQNKRLLYLLFVNTELGSSSKDKLRWFCQKHIPEYAVLSL